MKYMTPVHFLILLQFLLSCTKNSNNVQTPPVIKDSGTVVIYTTNNSGYPLVIKLNNQITGILTNSFSGNPTCGTMGTLTVKMPVGLVNYQGYMLNDKLWQGNIVIKKDSCSSLLLKNTGDANLIDATPVDSIFSFKINNNQVAFRYPWRGRLIPDGYQVGGAGTNCVPLFQSEMKLGIKAYNHYREPLPITSPGGICSTAPGGNIDTYFDFNCKMNNRPIVGQQFSSCSGQFRFKISFGSESPYHGLYGIENPGDYLNLTITNVTGLTVSGTFEGFLTQYKMINCQKIILGRSTITNGVFKTKYRYN